jgi:hypothetical protein
MSDQQWQRLQIQAKPIRRALRRCRKMKHSDTHCRTEAGNQREQIKHRHRDRINPSRRSEIRAPAASEIGQSQWLDRTGRQDCRGMKLPAKPKSSKAENGDLVAAANRRCASRRDQAAWETKTMKSSALAQIVGRTGNSKNGAVLRGTKLSSCGMAVRTTRSQNGGLHGGQEITNGAHEQNPQRVERVQHWRHRHS